MSLRSVLVTGANGFLGNHLLKFLNDQSINIYCLGTAPTDLGQYFPIGFNDRETLLQFFEMIRPDAVFHLAGVSESTDLSGFYEINTLFASNIIWALKQSNHRQCPVILTGSAAEYGMIQEKDLPILETHACNPYDHYGISKLAQTLMGVREARDGLPLIMVRPFNMVGPGMPDHLVLQSIVDQIKQIKRNDAPPVIKVGNLTPQRDFIDVQDVIEAFWRLIQTPAAQGQIVNICSGIGTSIETLLKELLTHIQPEIEIQVDPAKVKPVDVPVHFGSNLKLMQLTSFTPRVTIQKSIENILNHEEIL